MPPLHLSSRNIVMALTFRQIHLGHLLMAFIAGGIATQLAAWYALAFALQQWTVVTLMLAGSVAGAGHPFRYWEHTMEMINAAAEERFGPAAGSAAAAAAAGLLATFISGFAGTIIQAGSVVFSSGGGGILMLLLSPLCGYFLSHVLTLVPPEPQHRRIDAFFALCAAPTVAAMPTATGIAIGIAAVAVSVAWWTAPKEEEGGRGDAAGYLFGGPHR